MLAAPTPRASWLCWASLPPAPLQKAPIIGRSDVSFQEIDQHFLSHPRQCVTAPVSAGDGCQRRCHAHPDAGAVVGRRAGVTVGGWVRHAAVAGVAALPVELDLDAVVAVGVDRCAFRADHDRRLLALHDGARVQQVAVAVDAAGAVRHAASDGVDAVAVDRTLAGPAADGVQARGEIGLVGAAQRAVAEQAHERIARVGVEIVVRQVAYAQDRERGVAAVELAVVVQREGRAGDEGADRARADEHFPARFIRLQLVVGDPLALGSRRISVGAGDVAAGQRLAVLAVAGHGAHLARTVIPARQFDGVREALNNSLSRAKVRPIAG